MKILITQITGSCAFTPQDGEKLYKLLVPRLIKDEEVQLDFTGVTAITSVFLNFSIGQLIRDFDISKIKVTGINSHQQKLLDDVINNAKLYYSRNFISEES